MKQANKELLSSFEKVFETSKNSELRDKLFQEINKDLELISNYLKLDKNEAFLYANIFNMNYNGDSVDIPDLILHFKCTPIRILNFSNELENLVNKNYLIQNKSNHRGDLEFTNRQYTVNEKITDAILKNKALPKLEQYSFNNIIDVLEKLYNLGEDRDNEKISTSFFLIKTKMIIKRNQDLALIKNLNIFNLGNIELYMILYLIWKNLNGNNNIYLDVLVKGMFEKPNVRIEKTQEVLSGKNDLLKHNLIELEKNNNVSNTKIKLSRKAIDIVEKSGIEIIKENIKYDNIINPGNIKKKQLFYNKNEENQINILSNLLKERKFKEIQNRLQSKHLHIGVVVLFFGLPGTGKTESVYQIAKTSGRKIMQVDISQSKSMWFGESEKIIKKVFTDYKEFKNECKKTPILLFNEADAIFSKRKDVTKSNVAQTENAIQNIILQEIENFNGILIATTNLVKNLDTAFERRFLFKIEFNKPNNEAVQKIWKSKLKGLLKKQYELLAEKYKFSGGQIDNIVKKVNIYEILNGKKPNFDFILENCDAEKLEKNYLKSVGFK